MDLMAYWRMEQKAASRVADSGGRRAQAAPRTSPKLDPRAQQEWARRTGSPRGAIDWWLDRDN
ncbi:MAG: hypothetical protein GY719_13325 [bacterium]|nr:hypothetical protein [bacterium]